MAQLESGAAILAEAAAPVYVPARGQNRWWAHFEKGLVVEVSRDRRRRYPGLESSAPSTQRLYLNSEELGASASHVVDAGCGAGIGTCRLLGSFPKVTAIDLDPKALAFARQLAPRAAYRQANLETSLPANGAQIAYFLDVIGQLSHPDRALWLTSAQLRAPGLVVVAEPRASAQQRLEAPVLRSYSARSLHALLARCGYRVGRWVSDRGDWIFVVAEPTADEDPKQLRRAEQLLQNRELDRACELIRTLRTASYQPLRLEALLLEAEIEYERGNRGASAAALAEARELDEGDARPLAGLSRVALASGRPSRAVALGQQAATLDEGEVRAHLALALALESVGPETALGAWESAHSLVPSDPAIARGLCAAAVRSGNLELAIRTIRSLMVYPSQSEVGEHHLALGWLLAAHGETLAAAREVRVAERASVNVQSLVRLREALGAVEKPR